MSEPASESMKNAMRFQRQHSNFSTYFGGESRSWLQWGYYNDPLVNKIICECGSLELPRDQMMEKLAEGMLRWKLETQRTLHDAFQKSTLPAWR